MGRVIRLNCLYGFMLFCVIFTIIFIAIGISTDPDIPVSIGRYFGGMSYGVALIMVVQAFGNASNKYYHRNIKPEYKDSLEIAILMNDPLLFGPADDSFGEDLLYYLPFKKWVYTFKNQIEAGIWHVIITSYSRFKKRLRVFDIIDMSNNSRGTPHHHCIRLTYDIDMSNSTEDNVVIIPRQVVLYDIESNVRIALDKDIYTQYIKMRCHTEIDQKCKELCQYVLQNAEFLRDGFEGYFREILEHGQRISKRSYGIRKLIDKGIIVDFDDFKPDAIIEVIDDDLLEILRNYAYYLQ